ncbi:MAG TPA: acetate--CoA ligase family protein, partial [Candidatus Dormibacteraeota bacterium]|nr:acetate--CoA ligase family protein [Candidatus Dormibacteraeota bacterium]
AAGQRASSSHTGALLAAKDATVDALFEQSGVVRCEFLGEMFDVASVLANQPVPKGDRVGIITNAGGFGILCADACAATGLRVPELSERLRAKLGSFLPAEAGVGNPVDMVASAPGDAYERAIDLVAASGEVDSVIAIFVPPLVTQPQDAAAAIRRAADRIAGKIPIVSVFTQDAAPPSVLGVGVHRVPVYGFPEEAARALSGARRWARWRQDATDPVIEPWGPHTDEAHALMAESFSSLGGGWLDPIETARLLACYAIPQARWLVAPSPVAAGAAAAELGGSVALKAYGPQVIHKTELGAVKLNLRGASEVRKAAEEMRDRLRAAGNTPAGFLIQAMVPEGVEMIVGMAQDPLFGPVVACGAGGTAVELLKDVQVRLSPLSEADAHAMIRQLTTFPLLDGYRGRPKANVSALKQLLMRVSTMVEEQPMIAELDLNPVIVTADGALVADARVRIESNLPKPPLGSRPRG